MEQKIITIGGTDYTLQKIKPREWLKLKERCKNKNGQPHEEKMYEEVLTHIVVAPKMTLDDFDDFSVVDQVVAEALRFQLGERAE